MSTAADPAALLPDAQPGDAAARLLLYAIRRMAAAGVQDAHAAHALLTGFGVGFRRPLVLLRALMLETSRVSARKLLVALCCCPRATRDETALLGAIADAVAAPADTHVRLARLFGVANCLGALSSAQAVATAFADLGLPLSPRDPA